MNFLIKNDYYKHIQGDNLNIITDQNDALLDECESIAIEEIQSYLAHRYDISKIFIPVNEYDNAKQYVVGDVVFYDDTINVLLYVCKIDSIGILPTEQTNWEQSDIRSAKIVSMTIDLSLYHLHSRINPRNIPDIRGIRRDDAVKWLEQTRDFKNNPVFLPVIESTDGTTGLNIKWGSNTITNNNY